MFGFAGVWGAVKPSSSVHALPALEAASTNEPLRQATARVFESWISAAAEQFERAGIPASTARELALSTLND